MADQLKEAIFGSKSFVVDETSKMLGDSLTRLIAEFIQTNNYATAVALCRHLYVLGYNVSTPEHIIMAVLGARYTEYTADHFYWLMVGYSEFLREVRDLWSGRHTI